MDQLSDNSQKILTEPENTLPEFTFDQLPPVMRSSVDALGWRTPMPVQAKAVPYLLDNRDMIVQSRTGSGKTGAFLIPLLMRIDPNRHHPQALALVPTRELAGQVYNEFQILGQGMGIEGALLYGGVGYNAQLQALRSGAQMIIGTPGRVLDHIGRRSLNLDRLNIIVFDEADEMLSMGFYPDMRELRRYLPRDRSSWMFSATMPYKVQLLAREFLREPEFLSLSSGNITVSTMEHRFYDVPPLEKDIMLMRFIELENPDSVIIFCNTKMEVEYVATVLRNYGYNADQLSGDLDQKSRERAMARIRNGETRFLVATDVAARGIDISDLSHVIQYDVPKDPDSYVHRAGRTARAGNTGVVITFICNMSEKSDLKKIARRYNIEFVELPAPTADEVSQRMAERLTIVMEDRFRTGVTRLERERMKRFLPLAKSLAESDDESALLTMLLDALYHDTFHHAPVPAPDTEVAAAPAPAPARAEQPAPRPQQSQQQQPPRPQQQEPAAAAAEGEASSAEAERKKKKRKRKKKRNRGGGEERVGEASQTGQPIAADGQPQEEGQGDRPAPPERQEERRNDRPASERQGDRRDDRPAPERQEERRSERRDDRPAPERQGERRNDRPAPERQGERRNDRPAPERNDKPRAPKEPTVEAGDGTWLDSIQVIEPENYVPPERSARPAGKREDRREGRTSDEKSSIAANDQRAIREASAKKAAPNQSGDPHEKAAPKQSGDPHAQPKEWGDPHMPAQNDVRENAPAESQAPAKARRSTAKQEAAPEPPAAQEDAAMKTARKATKKAVKESPAADVADAESPQAAKAKRPAAATKKAATKAPASEAASEPVAAKGTKKSAAKDTGAPAAKARAPKSAVDEEKAPAKRGKAK